MRFPRWVICGMVSMVLGPSLGATNPEEDNSVAASAQLAGEWKAVETEVGGEKMNPKELAEYRLVFSGNDCAAHSGKRVMKFRVVVDPDKSPRSIDLTRTHDNVALKGIYELKEGKLWLLLGTNGGKRPTEFKTKVGTDEVLRIYERVEPQSKIREGIGEQHNAADSR
jgi:uncharacterized protein (TIGR03067 family)